ncbi:MAG: Outer rane adhesin like protein, partial [Verrucomicrobiales bacterium]|nr:Outer rane adhesin like protein [Verrucomicrobiales bacterium]
PDSSSSVIVAPVNDSPVITGVSAPANMQDNATIRPFTGVLISDVDESSAQRLTVTVALDHPANGSFAPGSLTSTNGTVVTTFVLNNAGYVAVGTPADVTAAIHQLVFVPTAQLLPIGLATNVVLIITADDAYGGVNVNGGTRLHLSAVSGAPFVSVPSQQPLSVALVSPLQPLGSVEISGAQDLTVTVQVNSAAGTFTSNSLAATQFTNTSAGVYVFHGSSTNATTAIHNLEFSPDPNLLPGAVIRFTIAAVDPVPNSHSATLDVKFRRTQRSWIVTRTSDYLPGAPDAEKFGTLRKSVEDASSNDHITFDLRSGDANTPDYPAVVRLVGPISLGKNLTFDGPGASLLSVSGGDTNGVASVQLFVVEPGVAAIFNGLSLIEGFHPFAGGGVEVNPGASLKLSYCTVKGCVAGIWGGGIDVDGGSLMMDHCLVQSNSTSVSLGQGGGGISLYTDRDCMIVDTTFAANQQLSSGGLGGGALYVENRDVGHPMEVVVTSCTFHDNTDAAGLASSIRPNVFDANVLVQNSIFADAQGYNLYLDGSGMIVSLGGNLSDDSTKAVFSIGGVPFDHVILDAFHDQINLGAGLLPLAANGGATRTFALTGSSLAINSAVSNETSATFFGTLGTDQRGYWRKDGHPDKGAFERGATNRIIIEEIHFAPASPNTNDEFIEFYVPRDSASVNLANYQVYVGGVLRHIFASTNIAPGQALVLFSKDSVNTSLPAGVTSQISSNRLSMDDNADTITLKNASTQTVFEVSYLGAYVSSDTNNAMFLTNANQSIVLSPQFQGCLLPYQRVAQKEGGPSGRTNDLSGAGQDVGGNSFSGGNAPPRAFNDFFATDAHTAVLSIDALANDLELDAADAIQIVGVGVTNGFPSGAPGELNPPWENSLSSTSLLGATVTIVSNGASISYDPNTSQFLRSLPQGSNFVDTFQYTILDSSNGVDHVRGTTVAERSNNVVKATATISVTVTGVNSAPTPQSDGYATNPILTTTEDGILDFTTLANLLANDTDPNSDDFGKLRIVAIHPTPVYSNTLQIVTSNGALVTLDIRFNPAQTHIIYDPRLSPILLKLSTNQFLVDTFYYAVIDSHGVISSASVGIKVWGMNDAPTANQDIITAVQGTPLIFSPATLLNNDTDPDTNDVPRLVSVSSPSVLGARVLFDGTNVVYDPTLSSNLVALARKEVTNDTFTYVMTDGAGISRTSSVTVVITGVNDRPVAVGYANGIDEDTVLVVPSLGAVSNSFDPDVNGHAPDDVIRALAFTNRLSAEGAPVTLNMDGSFSYDPRAALNWLPANSNWVDSFSFTVLDGSLTMANDDIFSVQGNSANAVLPVLANDVALASTGGSNLITGVSIPTQGGTVTVGSELTTLVYTPAVNFSGMDTFAYSISDGQGGTDTAQVTVLVSVDAVNVNLVANPDSFTVSRGNTVNLNVLANDNIRPASGSTLTIVEVGPTSNGGVTALLGTGVNNSIAYTPNPTNSVPFIDTFSYRISGGGTIQATGMVRVTVVTNVLTANDDNFTVLAESGNT